MRLNYTALMHSIVLMFTQNGCFMEAIWRWLVYLRYKDARIFWLPVTTLIAKNRCFAFNKIQRIRNKRYIGVTPRKIIKKHS